MSEAGHQCYICLEEGVEGDWVSPCRCSGSLKWVHQSCLIRWVREHEATRPWSPVACPQCRTKLRLMPEKGALVATLEFIDTTVYPACKYLAGWFFGLVAFDAACTTFGIFTHSQVYGLDETLSKLSESEKLETLMRLHLTSISLVFFNSIPWERYLLKGLRMLNRLKGGSGKWFIPRLPGGKRFIPEEIPVRFRLPEDSSVSQIIFSSALLPVFANLVGNSFLFSYVDSKLTRVLIGGLTFLGVKGFLSMYLMQKREVRRKRMIITSYQPSVTSSVPE